MNSPQLDSLDFQTFRSSDEPSSDHKNHLLIVDDEDGPRQSIRMVFRDDYHIHLASSGEEALEIAKKVPIDVAICDIRMSGISGIDALRGLKEIDDSTQVVLLTAYGTLETARQAVKLGARDYIGKPFDVSTLRRAVADAMMQRKISKRIANAERELARISSELEETTTRAEMARTINDVYAGVLHDINNPLTIINCFIDLLTNRLTDKTHIDEKEFQQIREQLATIGRQTKMCSEISRRHLDFLQKPHMGLRENASVNLVLSDLRELIKVHPIVRQCDIQVKLLPSNKSVAISSAELTQILLNLVINALQHGDKMQALKVEARYEKDPVHPRTLTESSGTRLLHGENLKTGTPLISIAVIDQAGGIPPKILDEIFEPYFTTRGRGEGTGLGLSMVSRLVKKSQAALHLKSEWGSGTTFTIYLPVET
ncbi:MAG TPA: response regulator [Opitutales bacterium]|nr:response regulator [Opitutales bacterium]